MEGQRSMCFGPVRNVAENGGTAGPSTRRNNDLLPSPYRGNDGPFGIASQLMHRLARIFVQRPG